MFNGVSLSSIILLTSLGLAITFGLMRVINMAHGEFVMIGAYTTYVVQQIFVKYCPESIRDVYYFVAIPAAFGVTFILGSLLEKFIISRLYGREIDSLLATWGISLILQQAVHSHTTDFSSFFLWRFVCFWCGLLCISQTSASR